MGLQTGGAERASTAPPSTSQLMATVIDRVVSSYVLTLKFSNKIATKNVPTITLTVRLWCRRFKSRKDDKVSVDKIT